MKTLTSKLKTGLFTVALIAAALFAMRFTAAARIFYLQMLQMAHPAAAAPSTKTIRPAVSGTAARTHQANGRATPGSSPVAVDSSALPQDLSIAEPSPGDFAGHWQGRWNSPKQGLCEISIEVNSGGATKYVAYPTFSCIPISPLLEPESKAPASATVMPLGKLNPASAILTGEVKDGSLVFEVTKLTSSNDTGCVLTSPFTLTLFGSNQVATEFHDACGGGSVLLTHQPK